MNNRGIICSRTIGKPQVLLRELSSCAWCAAFCRIVFCVDLNPSAVPCGCPGDGWYAHWRRRPQLDQRIVEGDRGLAPSTDWPGSSVLDREANVKLSQALITAGAVVAWSLAAAPHAWAQG